MDKIIAIAINEYSDSSIPNLNNCISDIQMLIDTFSQNYQFEDVVFAKEKEKTTGKEIYTLLNDNLLNSTDEDSIFILFAGHGIYNNRIGTTYWQPSDASNDNPNSWFNISELLQMMNASLAKHISIISDSCFAGAIFESLSRDGGITAFESRASRTALTSGGIEKVSDGEKGKNSPFAKVLNDELLKNKMNEIPFTILANNVLMNFSTNHKQTPKFGGLLHVGHDGGSIILKRNKNHVTVKKNEDLFKSLQDSLSKLKFDYSKKEVELIKKNVDAKKAKNRAVKAQNYDDAAKYRDQERAAIKELNVNISKRLDKIFDESSKKLGSIKSGEKIDEEYEKYIYSRKKAEEFYQKFKESGKLTESIMNIFSREVGFKLAAENALQELQKTDDKIILNNINPNRELWNNNRNNLIESLNDGIIELLKCFARVVSGAQNNELQEKKSVLLNIIHDIHQLQLTSKYETNKENFDVILKRKNIEVTLLNWLRDIN